MSHYNQRYAFVSSERLDGSTGVGTSPLVLGLMSTLAKKGKSVALVAPPASLRLPSPLTFAWFNLRAARVLAEIAADVVIGFDGDGWRLARSTRGAKFVAFLTGGVADFVRGYPSRAGRIRRRSTLAAARNADLVVVTSQQARELLAERLGLPPAQTAVLSPAVDLKEWPSRSLPEHHRPRVFAVAGDARDHEVAWLAHACAAARRRVPDLELQICGARHPHRLHRLATEAGLPPDSVAVDGRARRPDFKVELGACDVFVQLEQSASAAPRPLWAMAVGRPVIVPDLRELRELTGSAAVPVPLHDVSALAAALSEVLGSRARAREWARRGTEHAAQATWDEAARRFGERLSEL